MAASRKLRELVDALIVTRRPSDAAAVVDLAVAAGTLTREEALIEFFPLTRPRTRMEDKFMCEQFRDENLAVQRAYGV